MKKTSISLVALFSLQLLAGATVMAEELPTTDTTVEKGISLPESTTEVLELEPVLPTEVTVESVVENSLATEATEALVMPEMTTEETVESTVEKVVTTPEVNTEVIADSTNEKAETTVTVVGQYIDADTQESLAPNQGVVGPVGASYELPKLDIPGYTLIDINWDTAAPNGTLTQDGLVNFVYQKNTGDVTVTAEYVDIDTGLSIADSVSTSGAVGTEYATSKKTIAGYELVNISWDNSAPSGTYTVDSVITYAYKSTEDVTEPTEPTEPGNPTTPTESTETSDSTEPTGTSESVTESDSTETESGEPAATESTTATEGSTASNGSGSNNNNSDKGSKGNNDAKLPQTGEASAIATVLSGVILSVTTVGYAILNKFNK